MERPSGAHRGRRPVPAWRHGASPAAVGATLGLAVVLAGCGRGPAPAPPAAPGPGTVVTAEILARGKVVFLESCADCHGTSGRGDGPAADQLPDRPRDQTDRAYMDGLTDREIAETVLYGGGVRGFSGMPALPQVYGDDLVAVIAWVRTLSRGTVERVELLPDDQI